MLSIAGVYRCLSHWRHCATLESVTSRFLAKFLLSLIKQLQRREIRAQQLCRLFLSMHATGSRAWGIILLPKLPLPVSLPTTTLWSHCRVLARSVLRRYISRGAHTRIKASQKLGKVSSLLICFFSAQLWLFQIHLYFNLHFIVCIRRDMCYIILEYFGGKCGLLIISMILCDA